MAEHPAERLIELRLLTIRSERRGTEHLLELTGELDLVAEQALGDELGRVEAGDAETIVIDLGGLSFIDSTGIKVLLQASERAGDSGRLRFLRGPEDVQRLLSIAGIESELPFADG